MKSSPYIWPDSDGVGRMQTVYFRREFKLTGSVKKAALNLFADTYYHLKINGEFVGYGPSRSYPEFPEYDTYDIAQYLKSGENVIALEVLHVGTATFHNLVVRGGMKCWGEIAPAKGVKINLTSAKDWKCHKSTAHDSTAPRFSFAVPPTRIYDERKAPAGWDSPGEPKGNWQVPVALKNQEGWGSLRPRMIPHLTHDELLPKKLLGEYGHTMDESIHSFRLLQNFDRNMNVAPNEKAFACTWIYSPKAQKITAGTWWGEHFLNGSPLKQCKQKPGQYFRTDTTMSLKKGWNFLFVSYGIVHGVWEMTVAVPRKAGLVFSAEKKLDSKYSFLVAGKTFSKDDGAKILAQNPQESPDRVPELSRTWKKVKREDVCVSPTRNLSWAKFGKKLLTPTWQVGNFDIPAGRERSLVFDMGSHELGRIFVEYEAPAGTVIDIAHQEQMRGERPDHDKNFLINTGERQIAKGGEGRMETFFPRGFRYLHVGVFGHDKPVTIKRVGIVSQVYPYEKAGAFECSDPFFNTIWEYGYKTLQNCSEDLITDCPSRERTLYGGDLLPETATALVTTGDWRLPKKCIEVFLQSQSPEHGWLQSMAPMDRSRRALYDYPLLVMINADWYIRSTGDLKFAKRCEPVFRRMMIEVEKSRDENGVYVNESAFIDWVNMTKSGRVCAVNAMIACAQRSWASILKALGKKTEAGEFGKRADSTSELVARKFWDKSKGAFADTLSANGKLEKAHYIATSAWAMLAASTSHRMDKSIIEYIRQKLEKFAADKDGDFVSPYGSFYFFGALYEKGEEGFVEECIRHLYSDMILDRPTGTIWEHYGDGKSLVHAWSSAPTYYLSTRALGVRLGLPDNTNADSILIAPQSETLNWAKGKVPHPKGLVEVSWKVSGKRLLLDYIAPKGVKVTVSPVGRLAKLELWVNGRKTG